MLYVGCRHATGEWTARYPVSKLASAQKQISSRKLTTIIHFLLWQSRWVACSTKRLTCTLLILSICSWATLGVVEHQLWTLAAHILSPTALLTLSFSASLHQDAVWTFAWTVQLLLIFLIVILFKWILNKSVWIFRWVCICHRSNNFLHTKQNLIFVKLVFSSNDF